MFRWVSERAYNLRFTLCFCMEGAVEGALALLDGVGGISSFLRIFRVRSEKRFARWRNRTVTKSFPLVGIVSEGQLLVRGILLNASMKSLKALGYLLRISSILHRFHGDSIRALNVLAIIHVALPFFPI